MVRILHLGTIAGVPQIIRDEQNRQGNVSKVAWMKQHQHGYPLDILIPSKNGFLPNSYYRLKYLLKNRDQFDIFHFHVNSAIVNGLDLSIWEILGKKYVLHYHGSEIRHRKESMFYKHLPKIKFVSTPDLLQYANNSIWIPNPSPITPILFDNLKEDKNVKIFHAPSDRTIKGTDTIIKVVQDLKDQGFNIDLQIVENQPYELVHEAMKKSDIVIDWINPDYGIYGMVSIEAMSYGKPVICTLNPEHYPNYEEIPIINANPIELERNLIYLIENEATRDQIAKKGIDYVIKYHDVVKITKLIEKNYELL